MSNVLFGILLFSLGISLFLLLSISLIKFNIKHKNDKDSVDVVKYMVRGWPFDSKK